MKCSQLPDGPSHPLLKDDCFSTANSGSAERTILIIGSSHAQQWIEAIEPMAETHDYRIVALLRGGCPFGDISDNDPQGCSGFNEAATEYALEVKPDAVVTVASAARPDQAADPMPAGFPDAAERLTDAGIEVVGIRDNPRFSFNMQVCAEVNGPEDCTVPLPAQLSPEFPPAEYAGDTAFIDFSDLICPEGLCRPVIGNTYVYLDDNHLTTGFTASMAAEFERRFHQMVSW